MNNDNSTSPAKIYNIVTIGIVLLFVFAIVAAFQAVSFADSQYDRDLRNWEIRLAITADMRADAVQQWVDRQSDEIQAVADNLSVQLFLTEHELKANKTIFSETEQGQLGFLRNYIVSTAHRAGFAPKLLAGNVDANIPRQGDAGIVVLDSQNQVLTVTDGMPSLKRFDEGGGKLTPFFESAWRGEKALKDIWKSKNGELLIGFSAPVFAVQSEEGKDAKQIGLVVGVKTLETLFDALQVSQVMEKTTETFLVRQTEGVIDYLSSVNNKKPLELSLNMADKHRSGFAAGQLFKKPHAFLITQDYESTEVLATGRKIERTPWMMVHKVSRDEALLASDKRRLGTIIIGLLVIVLFVAVILAVWRHGSSVRFKRLADQFRSQERLLRLVSDNQPDAMYIVDEQQHYCFANIAASNNEKMQNQDMIGKTIRSVAGAVKADQAEAIAQRVSDNESNISHIQRVKVKDELRIIQSRYIPLARVPRVLTDETTPGILVVEQDITSAISEKEKRERLLDGLVNMLVSVVDKRDHFSADHSIRVAKLAGAVGSEMNLAENLVETVVVAAKLMNLGKIIMPRELLAKKGKYTAAEKKLIAGARKASAEFIHGLEFNGPVEDTLLQVQESWDGSGALGLEGQESLVTARIVSISNEFVAMTSPRAYRDAMTQEDALSVLMEQIGKKYERKLVVALVSYIENHQDEESGSEAA